MDIKYATKFLISSAIWLITITKTCELIYKKK